MGHIGQKRIARRHEVPTVPITWKVPRRRSSPVRSRRVKAEAAIVEISLMGLAIVAPDRWGVVIGNKIEVFWEGQVGWVWIRRMHSLPGSAELIQYGVEYADPNSQLAAALYERYVNAPLVAKAQAAQRVRDATEDQPIDRMGTPSMWVAPIAWSAED